MSNDAHFESLRRAYDDRVKSLTKKLKSTYSSLHNDDGLRGANEVSSSTSGRGLQHQMQEIVESELTGDREFQVESLLRQVTMLKADKRKLAQDLENLDRRTEMGTRELKAELTHSQQQLAETRREHTRVVQQLKDNERYSVSEKEWSMRSLEEKIKFQEERALGLEDQLAEKSQELVILAEENREFRHRLERLYQERTKWQEEIMAHSRAQNNVAGELEESQRLLAQSEVERIQLRTQYLSVGEKFERLMDVEEKENGETVRQLVEKLRDQKERSERYRKKCDRLSSDGLKKQNELRSSMTTLQDKDEEIERLSQRLKQESDKQKSVRSEMLELQQKSFQEQAACLERTNAMIPLASHHQIVDEQARQNALTLQEEHTQVLRLRRALEDTEKRRVKDLEDASCRATKDIEDVERQRDESVLLGTQAEEECVNLQKAIQESAESKKTLAVSLEEAHKNMTKLRQLLAEENDRTLKSEQMLEEVRSELTGTHEMLEAKEKEMEQQARWAEDFEATFGKQLRSAEEEVDRLIDRCRDLENKEEIHKNRFEELQKRFDALDVEKQRLSQRLTLEQHHAKRTTECFNQLHSITRTQIDGLRKDKQMLRDAVRLEFDHMMSLWSGNVMDKWQRLCSQHSRSEQTKGELRSKLEEAVRKSSNLAMDNATVQSEFKSLQMRLDQVIGEKDMIKRYSDSQEEHMQLLITNMERMMMSVGEKSDLHASVGAENFSDVVHAARRSFNDAVSSRVEREKEEAREHERDSWEKKFNVLRCDMAASQEENEEEVSRLQNLLVPAVSPRAIEEALHRSELLDQQSKTLNERVRLHLDTS